MMADVFQLPGAVTKLMIQTALFLFDHLAVIVRLSFIYQYLCKKINFSAFEEASEYGPPTLTITRPSEVRCLYILVCKSLEIFVVET